jgi:hypothetical protein
MIYIIQGAPKSGKSFFANTLRNQAVSQKRGALLIDDFDPHKDEKKQAQAKHLVEKLLIGTPLPGNVEDLNALPWKKDPVIILVGERGLKKLAEIEALVPGFKAKFGPVSKLPVVAA